MKAKYIVPAIIIYAISVALYYVPEKSIDVVTPDYVLIKSKDDSRFVTTHALAERIIEQDPSLKLVDVRMIDEFESYSIKDAINIPFEEIVAENWMTELTQEGKDIILFSNGDVFAEQAWNLCVQKGYKNLYILKGGLNEWFRTIIVPEPPPDTAPSEAFDLYSFEKAASIYFGGTPVGAQAEAAPKKNVVVRKKNKKAAEGGC